MYQFQQENFHKKILWKILDRSYDVHNMVSLYKVKAWKRAGVEGVFSQIANH